MQGIPGQQGSPVTSRPSTPTLGGAGGLVQQGGPEAPRVVLPGQGIGVPSTVSAAPTVAQPLVRSDVVGGGASARVDQAGSHDVSGAAPSL